MKRKCSISEDQKKFREIVLNKKMNHWQKSNKLFIEHADTKKIIESLKSYYKIKEPYATNIAYRFFTLRGK